METLVGVEGILGWGVELGVSFEKDDGGRWRGGIYQEEEVCVYVWAVYGWLVVARRGSSF